MKRLIQVDPDSLEHETLCTFELVGGQVVVDPPATLDLYPHIKTIVTGAGLLTPANGAAYYAAVDRALSGTYYFVREDDDDDALE